VPDHAAAAAGQLGVSGEAVGGVLGRVLENLGLTREMTGWQAVEAWPRLVGPRVARHARAVAFRNGTLHVEVEGSAWMQELSYLKPDLARRINQHLGSELVRELRLTLPRVRQAR
jgi:predicted nucleic acid-binding Zn ribbon protein